MPTLVCSICGKEVDETSAQFYDGQAYCGECYDNNFAMCERCNKVEHRNALHTVYTRCGTEKWCSDCVAEHTYRCDWCDTLYSEEVYSTYIPRYGTVCDYCLDEDFRYCERCDRYVHYEDYDSERECCTNCISAWIDDYHTSVKYKQGETKKHWRGLWRGLGFELEIDRDEENKAQEDRLAQALISNYGKHLALEYDGSLENGFEIISAPHTVEEFYKFDWGKILNLCKEYGYCSHDMGTCGLHIHISRNFLGATYEKQNTALAKIIYFYEHNWSDILALSRRTEKQAEQWANRYCVQTKGEAQKKVKSNESRYYAINNTNNETVEFRLCRGTLNENSFYAWIDFTLSIVKNSRKIKWSDIDNIAYWLKGISEGTKNYMQNRNAFQGVKICA